MRSIHSSLALVAMVLATGCDDPDDTPAPAAAGGSGTQVTGGQGGASGASAGQGGQSGASGGGGQTACAPGATQVCVGVGACEGGQACLADGSGWGACQCGTGGQGGAGGTAAGASGAGGAGTGGAGAGGAAGGSGAAGSATGGTAGAATGGTAGQAGSSSGAGGSGAGGVAGGGSGGSAPALIWATTLAVTPDGSTLPENSSPSVLAIDPQGNTLVAGSVTGTFAAGGISTGQDTHGVVLKLDPAGNLLWVRDLVGSQVSLRDIALDASGNPIVVGTYKTIDLGQGLQGQGNTNSLPDMLAMSLSSADGSLRWGRTWGAANQAERLDSVSVSGVDGDIVVTGVVVSSDSIPSGVGPVGPGLVEMHLDGVGKTKWAFTYGGGSLLSAVRVRHKPDGNYVVAGSVLSQSGATFGTGGEVVTTGSWDELFVAELTGAGASVQTRMFSQDPTQSAGQGTLGVLAMGADRVVVAGQIMLGPSPYHAGTDFGSGTARTGPFVAAFGGGLTWRWDQSSAGLGVRALAIRQAGAVVVAGTVNDVGLLTSYDPQGVPQPITYYPHTDMMAVAVAPDGSAVFAARHEPGADLGSGPLTDSGWAIVKTP